LWSALRLWAGAFADLRELVGALAIIDVDAIGVVVIPGVDARQLLDALCVFLNLRGVIQLVDPAVVDVWQVTDDRDIIQPLPLRALDESGGEVLGDGEAVPTMAGELDHSA